ncbi:Ribosomal RNA small subunit methyltransferase A [Candidatus Cyrtobacter comes]|uniref:Ribosomal RNA small subunit methyltransferase A n=1 Tax=Candidatus Cyrtobacter comes TaxID=675776 RepID=A0ABU5L919_9RICK|nr:16S rRNA (adenine(1518)-N(6)/adenine(1519)-N(6))-dimethyltransferase RsmA [Candidatus Cyrtobacter comes]MDZ5762619.1 Ribosomal RNA small subunit methyltransferase A [Candidatus Cyrtobacter comes]
MHIKFYAKKSLGQNFLIDKEIAHKIPSLASDISEKRILEIGPGFGSLTHSILLQKPKYLFAIEKDHRFEQPLLEIKKLNENFNFQIGDALDNFDYYTEKYSIIANLPYSVATPLLLKWVYSSSLIEEIIVMVQKEVALRITNTYQDAEYSRLSIITQTVYDSCICFDVAKECFDPQPKVTSSVVYMKNNGKKYTEKFLQTLEIVTFHAFSQRRKKISNSLLLLFGNNTKAILNDLGIDSQKRAQDLSLNDFHLLTRFSIEEKYDV